MQEILGLQNFGEEEKKVLEFVQARGFDQDAENQFSNLSNRADLGSQRAFRNIQPLLSYEDYVRSKGFSAELAAAIIHASDPETVQRYNFLVRQFNGDLSQIIEKKDTLSLEWYHGAVIQALYKKESTDKE